MGDLVAISQGRIRIIHPANPVAAAEVSITQEARVRWEIKALVYRLVTDGNAADRIIELTFTVGGAEVMRLAPVRTQIASQNRRHQWGQMAAPVRVTGGTVQDEVLPDRLLFNNEVVIATDTTAIQAGDQYSDIYLIVEEWIEPLA